MNTRFLYVLAALLLFVAYNANSQTGDPVLINVAGVDVTKSEFINVYKKNNIKNEGFDKNALEEYLDLYINFKLKVKEAEEIGLDTVTSFKTELSGYRKQLAQPYLTDKQVDDQLIEEAYQRMQSDIRASHIFIKLDKNASPEDTLIAYKRVLKIRERLMKGEPFDKVAVEVSEDEYARDREDQNTKNKVKGNKGDLGYFTVLDMLYPFETGAYNTKVNTISPPIHTDLGYHLIKVTDKRPAMGKVTVAHIFVSVPKETTPEEQIKYKEKIDEAYKKLQSGEKFEDVVKEYSDDKGSAAKGGVLPPFGVNRMVPEFIVAISDLKTPGDISTPIQTAYGWHIIKLVEKNGIKPFEEEKITLKTRILRDNRQLKSRESIVNKIKKENNFKEFPGTIIDFYAVVDSSFYDGEWKAEKAQNLHKPMFDLAGKAYNQGDFALYIQLHQGKRQKSSLKSSVNDLYSKFIEETCINYEDSKLEDKYPDFKVLMKEYRDGILLFELTDKKVWSKAIKDTLGLQEYYEKNKNNYLWDTRIDASIYTCNNEKTEKEVRKLISKELKGKMTELDILKKINIDSIPALTIDRKLFLKKDNPLIDSIKWEKDFVSEQIKKGNNCIIVVAHDVVAPMPKSIKEARGIITADYQNFLEKEWINGLRQKYTVKVNREVFDSIK